MRLAATYATPTRLAAFFFGVSTRDNLVGTLEFIDLQVFHLARSVMSGTFSSVQTSESETFMRRVSSSVPNLSLTSIMKCLECKSDQGANTRRFIINQWCILAFVNHDF
jgi:hypothetical protein